MLRDLNLSEFLVMWGCLLIAATLVVGATVTVSIPYLVPIVSLTIGYGWRRFVLRYYGPPFSQLVQVGIQQGLIAGGWLSVFAATIVMLK